MATFGARFRDVYGSHPRHLLTMLAGFALLGDAVVTAGPATFWKPEGPWWQSILVWLIAAFIAHDLVLFPIYALADRILHNPAGRPRGRRPGIPAHNYLRVPALGCALLLLVFFPGIIRQGAPLYFADTGLTQQPFLGRWLQLSAAMFAVSALTYSVRVTLVRRCDTDATATTAAAAESTRT